MAQLSIPQSLIGALIDIADLGTLDYFPPTERCAHWSLYDAQRQELLCPCTPAATPPRRSSLRPPAKILYENFPRYIDSPEEIIPYTSRQELVAALRRGDEEASDTKPAEEEQTDLQATEAAEASMAETPVAEANEGVVSEDAAVSATATPQPATPKPAAPKPAPSPALFAARAAQAPAPTPSPAPSVPEEASVEAPAEATAEKTAPIPTPATAAPAALKPQHRSRQRLLPVRPPPVCSASPRSPTDHRASKSTWRVCAPASRRPKPPPRKPRSR